MSLRVLQRTVKEQGVLIEGLVEHLADLSKRIDSMEARPPTVLPPLEVEGDPLPIPPFPKALRDIGLNPPLPKEDST